MAKSRSIRDLDDLFEEEKKESGTFSRSEQRPESALDDSLSSMNSEDLISRIKMVVNGGPFANGGSQTGRRSSYAIEENSFSTLQGINENTLLGAGNALNLSPNAAFWYKHLTGSKEASELPVVSLPKDPQAESQHNMKRRSSFRSSSRSLATSVTGDEDSDPEVTCDISKLISKGIPIAAKRLHTTPMIVYLCACEILLKRWTGEDDLVLGLTTRVDQDEGNGKASRLDFAGNRHGQHGSRPASSSAVNTYPMRMTGANAERTIAQLVQVRDSFWKSAISHLEGSPVSQYSSITDEIESRIDSKKAGSLFQVFFDYMNKSQAKSRGLKWTPPPCSEDKPLRVSVLASEGKILVQYSESLWTKNLANTFLQNFMTLLRSVVECAATKEELSRTLCSTIQILPQEQIDFLNRECYGPVEKWSNMPLMHQWFEQAADDNPNGIALKIMKEEMTYREVETKANKLARYLVDDLGVEVEDIVAILMPRGFDQIIALLAVLKAGAAYVPCDMTYPRGRIETIMDDADSYICLTIPEGMKTAGDRGVDIYQRRKLIENKESSRPNTMVYLDNLAYILYTSGSTGKPKGVEIQHNTVANYGNIVRKRFGLKNWRKRKVPDNVLMTARISWDASLESLMLAFTNASTLCLISSEYEDSLVQNIELIATEMKVTRMSCAPGFSQWMDPSRLKRIQLLIFGGDVLPPTTAEAWQYGNVTALNSYGPTEATCCVTDNIGIENAYPGLNSVPLGKPYDNTVTLVLDKNRQLCPPGVPGECYITGDCLARGYRNLPEVTNKAFVTNPFDNPAKKEGETRMYKTGDLVSMLPDGQLIFVGRIQSASSYIKLRGYRIELGEIMSALDDHPVVTSSIAIPDMEQQKLLAFVTIKGGAGRKEAVSMLLDHCLDRLVDYMVPDRLMVLDNLPLDANGKIDRKALIQQSRGAQHSRRSLVQAESDTQRKLTEIFAQSLGIDSSKISVSDNFFALGGHSLLAASAVSSIRETFNTDEFGVRDFFSAKTIKDMASVIDGHLSPEKGERKMSTSAFVQRSSYISHHVSVEKRSSCARNFVKLAGVMTVSALVAGCFLPSIYLLNGLPWAESQENASYLIIMLEAALFAFLGSLLVVSWIAMNIFAHDVVHSRKLRPGTFDFFRWYVADQLWRFLGKKILLPVFGGTPWLSFFYRMFGAKIGRGVFIEDCFFRVPRLVSIGNFVVVQSDAILENVKALPCGDRVFGKVTLHDRVVVGCRSVLGMGCEVGKFSIVRSVSNVPADGKVPANSIVSGTKVEPQNDTHVEEANNICSFMSNMLWHIFSPLLLHVAGLFEFIGMLCVAWGLLLYFPLYAAFVFMVALHPVYLAVIKIGVAIIGLVYRSFLLCGGAKPAEVVLYSSAFYRYWAASMTYQDTVSRIENTIVSRLATKIMGGDVDLHSLYTTEPTEPGLCTMGKNVFVANGVKLRNMSFEPSGKVRFGRVVIGDDCMLMDRAVIAEGSVLGKGVTIGVLTPTIQKTLRASSLYVGNPPFEKASVSLSTQSKRKSVKHNSVTQSSIRQLDTSIASGIGDDIEAHLDTQDDEDEDSVSILRSTFEYLMIGYGSLLSLEAPLLGMIGAWFYIGAGAWIDNFYIRIGAFVGAAPVVGILIVAWMMMSAIFVKRLLIGDFSTYVGDNEFLPETHLKVFRWRLTYLLVCDSKKFLQWVDNYDLTRIFWRQMGVKVGERVMINPEAYMYETDLLHLADGVEVDEMATLFCHTFRTRHLELKPIYVGACAVIGINSVVLPGCQIGSNVDLLPLTQVFPTERIKAGVWHGNPAEPVHFSDSV